MTTKPKKLALKIFLVYALIFLFTISPIVSVLISSQFADFFNCQLDEGSEHSCVVGGMEFSGVLYFMFVAGWFMFFTMPAGIVVGILFTVGLVVYFLLRSKSNHDLSTN